jgi:hypothetical protein
LLGLPQDEAAANARQEEGRVMSVCAARPEPEGFFTTCASVFASGKCKCGDGGG